ncbi:MAG: aspartate kinase [Candidatus Methanospirareceae archaeon]
MRVVMKFGGKAVANGEKIRMVANLIKYFKETNTGTQAEAPEIVAVTSALSGVTDMLLDNVQLIAAEGNMDRVKEFVDALRMKHEQAASDAIASDLELETVKIELRERLAEMEKALSGICLLGELTPRSLDFIGSFGERLAAPILAGTLRSLGLPAVHLTGGEAGILTNDDFGNAQLLENALEEIRQRITPLLKIAVPVVAGFMGENQRGIVTTLGRGGSDYTATIIGAAIDADEIWLWKETEGIMSADPKIIAHARKLPYISYHEAMELSYFGASVLHPRAIEPVMAKKIPIRVKNLFKPEDAGTLISNAAEQTQKVAKAITLIENTSIINVTGTGVRSISDVAARVFSALATKNIDIIMISQGSSEMTISLVVGTAQLDRAMGAIRGINAEGTVIRDCTVNSDVSTMGVVGAGMVGIPGVAGKVFAALGSEGISVIMISQGSSEFNISLVVKKDEAHRAAQAIHDVFEMGA